MYRAFALFFREACRSDGFQQLCRFQGDGLTATDQKASAAVGFGLLHSLVQALAEDGVKVVAGLFQQALGQGCLHTRRCDEEDLVERVFPHARHGLLVFFLFLGGQAVFQRREKCLGSLLLG